MIWLKSGLKNHKNRITTDVVNGIYYLVATILTSVLGLVSAFLMTHIVAPEEYGRIGIFFSVLYVVAPIVSLSVEGLIAVNKSTLSVTDYVEFQRTAIGLSLIVAILIEMAAILAIYTGVIHDPLLLLTPIFALIRFLSVMAGIEYISEQQARIYCSITVLGALLALGLTWGLLTFVSGSAFSRVVALVLADFFVLFYRYFGRFNVLFFPRIFSNFKSQIYAFGAPTCLAVVGAWGLNEADKIIVARQTGLAIAGLYTAAASFAVVTMNFNQALTNALFPSFYRDLNSNTPLFRKIYGLFAIRYFLLVLGFSGALMLGYYWLSPLILPEKYSGIDGYFYSLVLANISVGIYRPLGLVSDYFKLAKDRACAVIFGGIMAIAVGWYGVGWAGNAVWAAVGIGIGYLSAAMWLLVVVINYDEKRNEMVG